MHFKLSDFENTNYFSIKEHKARIKVNSRDFFSWVYKNIALVPIETPSVPEWRDKAPQALQNIVYTVFCDLNRSELVPNQVLTPQFSVAVPPLLYAYRDKWKYSEWYETGLEFAMGKFFHPFLEARREFEKHGEASWHFGDFYSDTISTIFEDVSDLALKCTGGLKKYALADVLEGYPPETLAVWNQIPPNYRRMLMQTWIFHPEVRTEGMILDLFDWDNTPEPLHTCVAQPKQRFGRK